jgi:putative salt-induced outer membrane protein YdiY
MMRVLFSTSLLLIAGTCFVLSAAADDEKVPGWYFDADLGGVWTGGNSETNSLGAAARLRRIWPGTELTIRGKTTETQSTLISRTAQGTPDEFTVVEEKDTEKTAEFYNLQAGARHDLSARFFAFGGADWMRNRFAGIDSRTLLALGAGNTWADTDRTSFRTYYNFTYTFQSDVVENPFVKSDFPGLQFGYAWEQQITTSTRLISSLVADLNLDNSDDIRADWLNELPVSISSKLELKPGLRLLWRNEPSLTEVPLVDASGTPTGESVRTPLKELDTIFTLALVLNLGPSAEE